MYRRYAWTVKERWIPVVARIEWHSGGKAGSRPVRLQFGGERVALEVIRRAYVGPAQAGEEVVEEYLVVDTRRRVFRIRARGGVTVVEMARSGS